MTKAGLTYAVYDVRRTVNRERSLPMNPEQRLGKFQRQERREELGSQAPYQGESVWKLTRPIPVTR